jgi:signal transduction histidine kinase
MLYFQALGNNEKILPANDRAVNMSGYRRHIWLILAGAAMGFFVIQPLNVLVYNLAPKTRLAFHELSFWQRLLEMTLNSTSLFMGLAYGILGGLTGHFVGAWLNQRDRLAAEQTESARRLAALQTLKELMVTLAHYIRNANMVIGGFSDHLLRHSPDRKHEEHLRLIHQASREIEAVIDSLQNLTEISATQYIAGGSSRMIDLKKALDERLAATKKVPEKNA